MIARPQPRPITVTTHGTPATGDLRALAAILLQLDQRPLKIVTATDTPKEPACQPA